MRYFTLLDFQHWVMAIFFGLLVVILISVAWGVSPEPEDSAGDTPLADHLPVANPIPPILILVCVWSCLWALGYVIIEGILGGSFN